MRRRSSLVTVLAIAALAMTGCSTAIPEPGPDAPSPTPTAHTPEPVPHWGADALTTPLEPAWVLETTPVGSAAVIVDDTVIAYVSEDGHPFTLIGADLHTGERLWTWKATVIDSYFALTPVVVDDGAGGALIATTGMPVWNEQSQEWFNSLALLDPTTGTPVTSIDDTWVNGFYDCGLPGGVCFWALESGEGEAESHYGLLRDGTVGFLDSVLDDYAYSAYTGNGIYTVRDADEADWLVMADRRVPQWAVPQTELWTPNGTGGLMLSQTSWTYVPDQDILLYQIAPDNPANTFRVMASAVQIGAVDAKTGDVLWTRDGALLCWVGLYGAPSVACSGELGYAKAVGEERYRGFSDGDVELTAIDLRTGEDVWTRTVAEFDGYMNWLEAGGYVPFAGFMIYEGPDGLTVLDVIAEQTRPLTGAAMVACLRNVEVTTPMWSIEGADEITFDSGLTVAGCTASGTTSDPRGLTQAVALSEATPLWVPRGTPFPAETDQRMRVLQLEGAIAGYLL